MSFVNSRAVQTGITSIQYASVFVISALAVIAVVTTLAASFGVMPWLQLDLSFGADKIDNAGLYLQVGLTLLAVTLAFYLPTHNRIMRLENSHRRFHVTMDDVTRAYYAAHATDREGVFQTGSEFDAVRERMLHLRSHPELSQLEPELLELAAQMSAKSHDLAETYSDEKVDRARTFLRQRQQEVSRFQEQIDLSRRTVDELKNWMLQLESDETAAERQITALEHDLRDLLPRIGLEIARREDRVVPLSKPAQSSEMDLRAQFRRSKGQRTGAEANASLEDSKD